MIFDPLNIWQPKRGWVGVACYLAKLESHRGDFENQKVELKNKKRVGIVYYANNQ